MVIIDKDKYKENPYLKANFISRIFLWWLNPFFRHGSKSKLGLSDLYSVLPSDSSEYLGGELGKKWEAELRSCFEKNLNRSPRKPKLQPSLGKVIYQQFRTSYMLIGLFAFVEECILRIVQPVCLGYLIRYFDGELTLTHGHLLAATLVLGSVFGIFTHHPYFFGVQHVGMQVRVACCALVYRKALRLSQVALGNTTIGQMVNLLSNDVNRFDSSTIFLHYLWIGPLQTLIMTCILWTFFGPSCLVGIGVLLLLLPLQSYMGKLFSDLRAETAIRTDSRIRIMNEILNGMRVIKMYTWEKPFSLLVNTARKKEIDIIRKASYLRSINVGIFYVSSKLMIFLTLVVYVVTGNALTAEKVFVSIALLNNSRVMTLFFPSAISLLAESMVSVRRLEKFLLMEERGTDFLNFRKMDDLDHSTTGSSGDVAGSEEPAVILKHFYAKWNPTHVENTLVNISLSVGAGELVCLVGHVGCGKGSVLHAILKELPALKGYVVVNGSIAYSSQEAWVFAGTIKENIVFGRDVFDDAWYKEVVTACALLKDFELLPLGDETLVGDRGSGLSGGQRARISLARAVYANKDIYLLDDPLSAVDAEVGRHLFEKCINGILKNKLRILVTHQVQFLKNVKRIVLLSDGRISDEGNYEDLIESGIYLSQSDPLSMSTMTSTSSFSSRGRSLLDSPAQIHSSLTGFSSLLQRRDSVTSAESTILGQIVQHDEVEAMGPKFVNPRHLKSILPEDKLKQLDDDEMEGGVGGTVKWATYREYFRAGSNCCSLSILIVTNILTTVVYTGSDYWLQIWTSREDQRSKKSPNTTMHIDEDIADRNLQLIIYSVIIFVLLIFSIWRVFVFFQISMNSSITIHATMFHGIIRAPMRFFEVNPVGRILNRFSRDVGNTDENLPPIFMDAIGILLTVVGIVVIIAVVNPYLLIPAALLVVMFHFLRRYYLHTSREIKRIEAVARSPVFSHLSSTLYGLTTIRSFGVQNEFIRQFDRHQDHHTTAWFLFIATTRWFGIWLDWISLFYIAAVTYSFMFNLVTKSIDGAQVGFTIATVMTLTGMFQWGVRQSTEVETQMISVERMLEYTKLESEAPLESEPGNAPAKNWPWSGEITLTNLSLKYGEVTTLQNINCEIRAAEKVGIVGRTGAGKSSLINALFRIAEPTGDIQIDHLSILKIGLHDLRSKLSIIPQEPVLFEGTLRYNLDPLRNYQDADIWKVLKDVSLYHHVRQQPDGLDQEISEDGKNFSIGSKQLICIGRAILKQNKIIILDEATANVDSETDAFIQKTIRVMFRNCTVLTVAHRLNTVMDSDRILVLDNGSVQEFDEPWILLQNKSSALYHLVEETGKSSKERLMQIAKMASDRRLALKRLQEKLSTTT